MGHGFWTSLIRFLLLFKVVKSAEIPDGVHRTECHDRYFMIAVDLSFTGQTPYFQAVDRTGVFDITEQYAAQCGYTVSALTVPGIVELRASYFSCHTTNKDDQTFTFSFNLIATRDDEKMSYQVNKTCSPSLDWSLREVTCEFNYLEVSVKNDVLCPLGPKPDSWESSMQIVYSSATPDWQVILVKDGNQMKPLKLNDANLKGYSFTETSERLVFRAAYGLPHSSRIVIDGVTVEVAHAILFSRQEWVVLLLDLVAPCTLHDVAYDDGGYVTWKTPLTLHPGLHTTNFSFGLNGELWETIVAEEKGFIVTDDKVIVKVGIPLTADGAYRESSITGDLFDVYTYHLYMEQIATSDEGTETRSRSFRKLTSPPIKRFLLTENRSVPDEEMFTVYLANVPRDLELVSIQLNEKEFKAPFVNSSSYTLSIAVSLNKTFDYTLKVPFENPIVLKQFSAEKAAIENKLNVVYSFMINPESDVYSYRITVAAFTDIAPPEFATSCSESSITFTMDHKPSNVLWEFTVGSDRLTPELAAQQGYLITNNSHTLQLEVPVFSYGYTYEDITLEGFTGTFETLVRDRKTSEVKGSSVKTCPFTANEIVVCSKDGKVTVVADLSQAVSKGGSPDQTSLLDEFCGPKETDETRVLYSYSLNSCGTRVKLNKRTVTYINEIRYITNSTDEIGSVLIQCTYHLAALHPLFSLFKFESDMAGVGLIVHSFSELENLSTNFTVATMATIPPITTQLLTTTEAITTRTTRKVTQPVPKTTARPTTTASPVKTRRPIPYWRPPTTTASPTRTRRPLAYWRPAKYLKVLSYSHNVLKRENSN